MTRIIQIFELGAKSGRCVEIAFELSGAEKGKEGGFICLLSKRNPLAVESSVRLPVLINENETRTTLPDDSPNTWEITDSRQPLIQLEMGMQSCPLASLISLRQAATPGGDNKKGKQSQGTPLWSVWIHFSQQLHVSLIRQ